MRKRSKYRPRSVINPLIRNPLADTQFKVLPQAVLTKFKDGTADAVDVNTLTMRLNTGYVMSTEIFDTPEATATLLEGLQAIRGVINRLQTTGRVGATGAEYNAIGAALTLTDEMQDQCTQRQHAEVMAAVLHFGWATAQ